MPPLKYDYLLELEKYLASGELTEDFGYSSEDRRLEILGFLEKLMELGELADEVATRIIFRRKE